MEKRRNYLIIIIFNLAAFFLAYLKDLIVANKFGTSVVTDQYFLFLAIVNTLFLVAGGNSFKVILVPFFNKNNTNSFKNTTIKIIKYISLVSFLMIPFYFFFLYIMENEGNKDTIKALYNFWFFGFLFIIINSFNMYIESIFYYKKYYISNTLGPIVTNSVFIVLCLIFFDDLNITYLVMIFVISIIIRLILFLVQYHVRIGLKNQENKTEKIVNLKEFTIKVVPITLAALSIKFNFMIDNYFATRLETGAVSGLNYANRIYQLPIGLLSFSILSIIFSNLSSQFYTNPKNFKKSVNYYFLLLITFSIPLSIILFQYSNEVIDLIFGRGNFDESAIYITNEALLGYSIGLSMTILNLYLVKVIQSQGNTRFPSIISIISVFYNLILTYLLYTSFGLLGITASTSLTLFLNNILLLFKIKGIIKKETLVISGGILGIFLSAMLFISAYDVNILVVIIFFSILVTLVIFYIEKRKV